MDDDRARREVAGTFADLAQIVTQRLDTDDVCRAVVEASPRLITACDHASIMVRTDGPDRYRTIAASDDMACIVDGLERETGEGACVDAIESEAYQLDADIEIHSQWPALAARLLHETPVRGMAGYRLIVDGRKVGALNLFSDKAGALTAEAADAGVVLVSFASVALSGARERRRAETLEQGLATNREIGTAIGLLMAAHGLTQEQAFDTLRKASSQLNRKLASIAHDLVQRGPDQSAPADRTP